MTHGVRLYLVGSLVLVSLAGCGRGFFQAEREPWRAEAEAACLKSGTVKETPDLVRINPISGPGVCGAEFPLKVAAFGEANSSLGYADDLRPPGSVGAGQPRWPASQPAQSAYQQPGYRPQSAQPSYPPPSYPPAPSAAPTSLNAPGVAPDDEDAINQPAGYPSAASQRAPYPAQPSYSPPRLGPGNPVNAVGPVALKPTATLACPIVSVLDRWINESVQPAAIRWFGARVVEIKQISAYSCRGMNGNPNAHISEHAFGNALDIAAFTLSDGRRISVQDGWKGLPEEQGFLRDVEAGACREFTTVLAPGANIYHYNHIHVDLMRRASGRVICKPAAMSGEEVAARAMKQRGYAGRDMRDVGVTGSVSLGGRRTLSAKARAAADEDGIEDESHIRDRN
ncbi:MAG: extensin family protein [Rhizobiales bacterium]|nr:extensin family protein [Hyphomicrobiales bacterium]